jgi:hypothetical protein
MIERRAIASKAATRPADAVPQSGNGAPPPSLESQIAAALRSDASPSVADLDALVGEVEAAAAAAATTAVEERERALDISIDPATAHEKVLIAELRRDRLHAVLPRLQQRLAAAVTQESALRWDARYRRVAALVEEGAEKYRAYPRLAAELVELMQLAAALDREASAVNISAAPGEHRRIKAVELLARDLANFSISQPSIAQGLRLPDWQASELMLFPRREALDPSLYAPPPFDVRFSEDWAIPGEQQRAAAAVRERQQVIADDKARRRFYGERIEPPETTPPPDAAAPPALE